MYGYACCFIAFWVTLLHAFKPAQQYRSGEGTRLHLNRLVFSRSEFSNDKLCLPADDYRSKHLYSILKADVDDIIKCTILDTGLVNAKITDKNENSKKKSCEYSLSLISEPVKDQCPKVDLILACPRPLRLERLLPVIACFGVDKCIIVGADKVEKDFFGSHLFRRPEAVAEGFMEGLSQSGIDHSLPEFLVHRNLKRFMEVELQQMFPSDQYRRIIAHPPMPSDRDSDGTKRNIEQREKGVDEYANNALPMLTSVRMMDIPSLSTTTNNEGNEKNEEKIVVAIGPEGGWTDKEYLQFLGSGFLPVHLGPRILRTDMAVPALLSLAHEWISVE